MTLLLGENSWSEGKGQKMEEIFARRGEKPQKEIQTHPDWAQSESLEWSVCVKFVKSSWKYSRIVDELNLKTHESQCIVYKFVLSVCFSTIC